MQKVRARLADRQPRIGAQLLEPGLELVRIEQRLDLGVGMTGLALVGVLDRQVVACVDAELARPFLRRRRAEVALTRLFLRDAFSTGDVLHGLRFGRQRHGIECEGAARDQLLEQLIGYFVNEPQAAQ